MGAYSIRYHARALARRLARDRAITYTEAEQRARAEAGQLPGVQRAIYMSIWAAYYLRYASRRIVDKLLREAETWE